MSSLPLYVPKPQGKKSVFDRKGNVFSKNEDIILLVFNSHILIKRYYSNNIEQHKKQVLMCKHQTEVSESW